MEFTSRDTLRSTEFVEALQRSFVVRVYGWMTLGLCITAAAGLFTVQQTGLLLAILQNEVLFWGLLIAEMVLVWVLSASIDKLSVTTARLGFIAYAALTGISLTPFVLAFTASSLVLAFAITAGLFGAMCLYGHLTRRDLASWGSFLIMSLIGLILVSILNWLMGSPAIDWILSVVGVAIFVGLSAHDAQNIRRMGASLDKNGELVQKAAIVGALDLYLDFLNLFLRLLAMFGSSDD
jgi:uncharacterized protein